jgi:hypothetical protein
MDEVDVEAMGVEIEQRLSMVGEGIPSSEYSQSICTNIAASWDKRCN